MTLLRIGLLGFGTVGSGIFHLINKSKGRVMDRYGINLEIGAIAVKHPLLHKDISCYLQTAEEIARSDNIDVIIEAIGGLEPFSYLKVALQHGKHVISANKTLVSSKFTELSQLAEKNNLAFRFTAAVGGATPILEIIQQQLLVQPISRVYGIFNATSNYILSQLRLGDDYENALQRARDQGLAEFEPTHDLDGTDIRSKLEIVAKFIFRCESPLVENVTLTKHHLDLAKKNTIKLLGEYIPGKCLIKIYPRKVDQTSPVFGIDGAHVCVIIDGEFSGPIRVTGVGAGKLPTANALLQDMINLIEDLETIYHKSISNSVI